MFKYLGSLLAVWVLAVAVSAQETAPADSAANKKAQVYQGTYLNVDVFNPIYTVCTGNRFEFEVSVDVGLWHRLFPKVEFGMQFVDEDPETADYHSQGFFFRAGADFNLMNFQSTRKYDHSLYIGVRYGVAHTSYALSGIETEGGYWNESGTVEGESAVYNSGWLEGVIGVRAEVCPHFLIGLATHIKFIPHAYGKPLGQPAYIPGYGRMGNGSANFGLSLTLTYQIPY